MARRQKVSSRSSEAKSKPKTNKDFRREFVDEPTGLSFLIKPKNQEQRKALDSIENNTVTFLVGPPGCGKSYLAVAYGLKQFLLGNYARIIFTRPCVEAYGEKLGFLPGDFNDKISPYMLPVFDILGQYVPKRTIQEFIANGSILTLPLAFQRGVTFSNSYVVGDEFQNTVPPQVRMMLTRLGENSKIVITGDPEQSDIRTSTNGLVDAVERLQGIDGVGIVQMSHESIVRHPLVGLVDKRYSGENY